MFRPSSSIQNIALYTLFIGAIGDWASTKIGLNLGLLEGNSIAAFLMSKNMWMQMDAILILICFTVPFLVNRFSGEEAPKKLFLFPLLAGVLKLGVSLWNISIILV
jgi:hypothetical protein